MIYDTGAGRGRAESFPISFISTPHAHETVNIQLYLKAVAEVSIDLASNSLFPSGFPAYYIRTKTQFIFSEDTLIGIFFFFRY